MISKRSDSWQVDCTYRSMKDDPKERWLELCALAAKEQDANKLIALVTEINRLLKEVRLHPKHEGASMAGTALAL